MSGRRLIEREARRLGFRVLSACYATPVRFEMGDGCGGWLVETDGPAGTVNGINAASVVEQFRDAASAQTEGAPSA